MFILKPRCGYFEIVIFFKQRTLVFLCHRDFRQSMQYCCSESNRPFLSKLFQLFCQRNYRPSQWPWKGSLYEWMTEQACYSTFGCANFKLQSVGGPANNCTHCIRFWYKNSNNVTHMIAKYCDPNTNSWFGWSLLWAARFIVLALECRLNMSLCGKQNLTCAWIRLPLIFISLGFLPVSRTCNAADLVLLNLWAKHYTSVTPMLAAATSGNLVCALSGLCVPTTRPFLTNALFRPRLQFTACLSRFWSLGIPCARNCVGLHSLSFLVQSQTVP